MEETPQYDASNGGNDGTGDKLREHQQRAGRLGGLSRSDAKRRSSSANLLKARINRWKGREAAARAAAGGLNGQGTPSTSNLPGRSEVPALPENAGGPKPEATGDEGSG